MNKINHIRLSDFQVRGIDPYKTIQELITHLSEVGEIHNCVEDEYEYLREVLSDNCIQYEIKP